MKPKIDIDTLFEKLPYRIKKKKGKKTQVDWQAEWERYDAKKLFELDLSDIPPEK